MSKSSYDPFANLLEARGRCAPQQTGVSQAPSVPEAAQARVTPRSSTRQAKKTVNFRLDPELLDAARAEAEANRMTLTALVTQALLYRLANPASFGSSSAPMEL